MTIKILYVELSSWASHEIDSWYAYLAASLLVYQGGVKPVLCFDWIGLWGHLFWVFQPLCGVNDITFGGTFWVVEYLTIFGDGWILANRLNLN